MQKVYALREELAHLQAELDALKLEKRHYDDYLSETNVSTSELSLRERVSSEDILKLWNKLNRKSESEKKISIFEKIVTYFKYGIKDFSRYNDISLLITSLQNEF